MDKIKILKKILYSAKLYSENLANKNLVFIYIDIDNKIKSFETLFLPRQFMHLTGIRVQKNILSIDFYTRCLENRLSINDFELAKDGTTILKMKVLSQLMELHKNAHMIGDYNHCRPYLYTEKIIGNVRACMGFTMDKSNFYVPNTILKEDIRDSSIKVNRIIMIYSKEIDQTYYRDLQYLANKINIVEIILPKGIKEKIKQ